MFDPAEIAALVHRIAAQVARGGNCTQQNDFIDESLTLLFEPRGDGTTRLSRYDPHKGKIEPWLAVTLRNLWRSRLRTGRRRPITMDPSTLSSYAAPQIPWDQAMDQLGCRFSEIDQARIDAWTPALRVELLAISGLCVKYQNDADDARWEHYICEAEEVFQTDLPRPFPPVPVSERQQPSDRIRSIADILGILPNTLSQRWKRNQKLLETLDFIRDLRGFTTDRSSIHDN
jgi:hypothetical protein